MQSTQLDLAADIIDVRDIIERVEELEDHEPESEAEKWAQCDEYAALLELLDELKGCGGDEQWRGDWYPVTLIRSRHFTDYVREMLIDCDTIPADLPSWVEIDWDATARNVKVDYSAIDVGSDTYWFR